MNRLGGNYGKCTTNGNDVNVKLLYNNSYTLQVLSELLAEALAYSQWMNGKQVIPYSPESFYKPAGSLPEITEIHAPLKRSSQTGCCNLGCVLLLEGYSVLDMGLFPCNTRKIRQ